MAASRVVYKDNYDNLHQEWVCDTDADIASLPTCPAGSTAIVLEDATADGEVSIYMANNQGAWIRI